MSPQESESHTATPLPYEFNQVIHDDDPFFQSPLAELESSESAESLGDTGESPEAANTTGIFELELSTTAESWVEIYDVDGKQLYFGMANIRAPIVISSAKALNLLIGNTPTVDLKINEQVIDLAPLSNDGVAKFTFPQPTQP